VKARVLETEDEDGRGRVNARAVEGMALRLDLQQATMAKNLVRLHQAGVAVVLGTDAGNPLTLHGPAVFPELEAMQAAGMPPGDVLVAATRDAAAAMGRARDLGAQVCRAGVLHERAALLPR
jgi:imidazolonepropionase-like amidohydrolase